MTFTPFGFYGKAKPGRTFSPEVQAVIDRMSALSTQEIDAIEAFVDGMAGIGRWTSGDEIIDVWCFALNSTDFLTSFVGNMNMTTSSGTITHVAQRGVEFATGAYYRTAENYDDVWLQPQAYNLIYNNDIPASSADPQYYLGCADLTINCAAGYFNDSEYQIIWGTDTQFDFSTFRQTVGALTSGSYDPVVAFINYGLPDVGGLIEGPNASKVGNGPSLPMQLNGANINGTSTNAVNTQVGLFMLGNSFFYDEFALQTIRNLAKQFMRDLGVTGVPPT